MRNHTITHQDVRESYSAAVDIVVILAEALAPKLNVTPEFLLDRYTSDVCLGHVARMYARRVVEGMDKVDAAVEVSVWLKDCTTRLFTETHAARVNA